jgi:hypothetical protein
MAQRVVCGNSCAEQRRCFNVTEMFRYRRQRFDGRHNVLLVSAVVADARDFQVLAIAKIPAPARGTRAVVASVPADADVGALSLDPLGNIFTEFINNVRDFVAWNARILNAGPCAFFRAPRCGRMPQACTLMHTCRTPGLGISRSTISKSPPGLGTCATFIGATATLVVAILLYDPIPPVSVELSRPVPGCHVSVPEVYSRAARSGVQATLTLDKFPGRTFHGTLGRNANSIDIASRTLLVEVDNPTGKLLPGA